ncbi:hypothetical protein AD428_08645 [Achromobacter sp. DMS1]|nr:hypothetical protein AD428_08645 [Achromobacter sp. DMS1]
MCALADSALDVHEYTALQIKKAVVGTARGQGTGADDGAAPAGRLDGAPAPDSADALACAICHAHVGPLQGKLERLGASLGAAGRTRLRNGRLVG